MPHLTHEDQPRFLQKLGTPIGAMDLLIATHALFLDTVLVTNNTKEFERVPDLKVENWLSDKKAGISEDRFGS